MNARQPVGYFGPTSSPCADAERWEDEQEAAQAMREVAERQAPLIVLQRLQAMTQPADWSKDCICTGKLWAPFEILDAAMESGDDATLSAVAELLTGPHAAKLHQVLATWFGKKHALDIYHEEVVQAHAPV